MKSKWKHGVGNILNLIIITTMSIVITALSHKAGKVYMMGDKRATHVIPSYGTSLPQVTHRDDYKKIEKITNNIFVGFTGSVLVVDHFKSKLKDAGVIHPTPIIKFVREYARKNPFPMSTVVIAGKFDENHLFLVEMSSNGMDQTEVDVSIGNQAKADIVFKISSDFEGNEFHDYFIEAYNRCKDLKKAMSETVLYASTISPMVSEIADFLETL